MCKSASHSSLERGAISSEIWEYQYTFNKERISQVKIIFKQKLYLEIAGHVSELDRSKKKILASKYFLSGEKRGLRYWAYDL